MVPVIAASKANMPFYRDNGVCQETPTFLPSMTGLRVEKRVLSRENTSKS